MAENEQGTNPQEESAAQQESAQPAEPVAPEPVAAEPTAAGQGQVSKDAKNMALLCHVLAIFTCFLGPLILWLLKKDDDPFIDEHGKEALNFQITVIIATVVAWFAVLIVVGCVLLPVIGVCDLVFCIIAAMKANNGELYRYPVSIRLIK